MKKPSLTTGRAGSPSQPPPNTDMGTGRAGSPNRPSPSQPLLSRPFPNPSHKDGALGESALPSALPQRKRLVHTPPPWAPEGSTFFITINCTPRGRNQLVIPAIASLIEESLRIRIEKGYWWPRLTLLMSDHIHTLMVFSPDQEMVKVIKDWKRYLARHAGIHWQRDFFDHRIRNEASLQEKWSYILQNPVRAGLVTAAEHWPYVWINGIDRDDIGGAGSPSIDNDLGRVGSPSRPHNFTDGALAESALPNPALPNPLPTTSKNHDPRTPARTFRPHQRSP
ncbi:MAG: transposase [Candidatus Binatia bacterium]